MSETSTQILTYRVDYGCECGKGMLAALSRSPDSNNMYSHSCTACGNITELTKAYPFIKQQDLEG